MDGIKSDEDNKITIQQTNNTKKPLYGILFSILASLSYVGQNLFLKKTTYFNQFDNSSIRYFLQMIVLFIIAKLCKQKIFGGSRAILKLLISRGIFGVFGMVGLYWSIRLINPSDVVSLFGCNTIFVAILSRIFLKEKLTLMHIIAIVVMVAGVFLITEPSFLVKKVSLKFIRIL